MGMVIGVESLGETLGSAMFKGLLDEHTQDLRSKRTVQYMLEHQTKMNWNILHYAKRYANGNIEVDALFNPSGKSNTANTEAKKELHQDLRNRNKGKQQRRK